MGEPWEAPTVLDQYIEHLKLEVDAATARAEAAEARVKRLEEALEGINRITSPGNRTLDEMIRDMGYANDRSRAALAAPLNRRREEVAWLIEIDGPRYLSLDPRVLGFWTSDHLLATRFGRRDDAENFMNWQDTFDKNAVRIIEHMWVDATALAKEEGGR